jgi:hypothetical protein
MNCGLMALLWGTPILVKRKHNGHDINEEERDKAEFTFLSYDISVVPMMMSTDLAELSTLDVANTFAHQGNKRILLTT